MIENNKITTTMVFSALPIEIKLKIFSMLSIGDQYYASLVWEEMAYEFWASIPPVDDFLVELENSYYYFIGNLNDLEVAGVLASAGYLEPLDKIEIWNINLSSMNVNILDSLTRLVKDWLGFYEVSGLCFSIFENTKCRKLAFRSMELHPLAKNINVKELIYFENVSGDVSGFLDKITCDCMKFRKTTILSRCESKSLSMMLKNRVRFLYFEPNATCDYSFLVDYDGLGSCESMKLICCWFQDTNMCKMKKILKPWAKSVGWTVEVDQGFLLQRSNSSSKKKIKKCSLL